jgi:hypothetical protein
VIALLIAAMAVACFVGAEKLERLLAPAGDAPPPALPRRLVFAGFGAFAALGLATLALPRATPAAPPPPARISPEALARRVLDRPWRVRVLDVRPMAECAAARVPGAECTPPEALPGLHLADLAPGRDLVVVAATGADVPADVLGYPGTILVLDGGFAAWRTYAVEAPPPPAATASAAELDAWRVRAAMHSAVTGVPQAPPPPAPAGDAAPVKRKAGGGGCSG